MHSRRALIYVVSVISTCCTVNLDSRAFAAATTGAAGTISIPAAEYGIVQNQGSISIGVRRAGGSSGAATVLCKTFNDTAVAGKQYSAVDVRLAWASGDDTPKNCRVPISAAHPFHGAKAFYVAISDAKGAALGSRLMTTIKIYGNLGAGAVALSASTYSVSQKAGSLTITVNRTDGDAGQAVVSYATANGTAIAGIDYTAKSGVLRWDNIDVAPKTFTIPINKAKPFAGTKSLAVAIARPVDVVLGGHTSAIVTIKGDAPNTPASTGEATLSWRKPTVNVDGSPLTDLAGYKIYYGTSAAAMNHVIQVSNPATQEYEISNLPMGTWYFAIAAYTTTALESSLSEVVHKPIS
jgi:hypothetical protein